MAAGLEWRVRELLDDLEVTGDRMSRLAGQAAIVTGGALGIGGATSRRLAEEGASVLIADVDIDAAIANAETIAEAGGRAVAMRADVSRANEIEAMVERAHAEFGRIDILVNNAFSAGLWGGDNKLEDISESDFDAGIGILVKAHFLDGQIHCAAHAPELGTAAS